MKECCKLEAIEGIVGKYFGQALYLVLPLLQVPVEIPQIGKILKIGRGTARPYLARNHVVGPSRVARGHCRRIAEELGGRRGIVIRAA